MCQWSSRSFITALRYCGNSHGYMSLVCLSQVGVLSKRMNESSWFWFGNWELPATYPTLCLKKSGYLQNKCTSLWNFASNAGRRNFHHGKSITSSTQEAQLSPSDRAMRLVSSNLANYHATVQKLLIRQVLTKLMVRSWRFSRRQCVIDNVHSTMTRPSRLPLSEVS